MLTKTILGFQETFRNSFKVLRLEFDRIDEVVKFFYKPQ